MMAHHQPIHIAAIERDAEEVTRLIEEDPSIIHSFDKAVIQLLVSPLSTAMQLWRFASWTVGPTSTSKRDTGLASPSCSKHAVLVT